MALNGVLKHLGTNLYSKGLLTLEYQFAYNSQYLPHFAYIIFVNAQVLSLFVNVLKAEYLYFLWLFRYHLWHQQGLPTYCDLEIFVQLHRPAQIY